MIDQKTVNKWLSEQYYPVKNHPQRLGQFLICKLIDLGYQINDPSVFYKEDPDKALDEFYQKYVFASMEEIEDWNKECEGIPKVDLAVVRSKVKHVDYHTVGRTTICSITAINDSVVTGESQTVHSARYNSLVGKRLAFNKAFDKLVEKEAYVLRTELSRLGQ